MLLFIASYRVNTIDCVLYFPYAKNQWTQFNLEHLLVWLAIRTSNFYQTLIWCFCICLFLLCRISFDGYLGWFIVVPPFISQFHFKQHCRHEYAMARLPIQIISYIYIVNYHSDLGYINALADQSSHALFLYILIWRASYLIMLFFYHGDRRLPFIPIKLEYQSE